MTNGVGISGDPERGLLTPPYKDEFLRTVSDAYRAVGPRTVPVLDVSSGPTWERPDGPGLNFVTSDPEPPRQATVGTSRQATGFGAQSTG